MTENIYDLSAKNIRGQDVRLSEYKGKVLLVVNVASQCGFTPQYKGLEELYQKYREQGFVVLAFPCNQFGAQEPGDSDEIASFCDLSYRTTFPLFQKIEVNGGNTHPVYQFLKKEKKGFLGTGMIKWNFTKFLVNRKGEVIERFAPNTEPKDIAKHIEAIL